MDMTVVLSPWQRQARLLRASRGIDSMRIYTRGGDDGTTQLLGPGRVAKDDVRVTAYGAVDEANAVLGIVLTLALDDRLRAEVTEVQADLFTVGSELATPPGQQSPALPRVPADWATRLEGWIDRHEATLAALQNFIIPGGTPAAAHLHLARCVCRRAEREVVRLNAAQPVAEPLLAYLNRLSDYLFVAARVANARAGVPDVPWRPARPA
jgi:cob(I)alamin adenosyltransferase